MGCGGEGVFQLGNRAVAIFMQNFTVPSLKISDVVSNSFVVLFNFEWY